ncbi:MAG: sulfatase-like hydrolase/transferase, partial [Planctomycetota bacterium]|nr:sulfatase-like hydrolase/transferase [Planctomycetota bacterium]
RKLVECNRQNEQRSVEDLLAFIDTRPDGGKGTFAYLHPDATHSPWTRFSEVEDFGDNEKDRYDQCVRYCDFVTGKLIDGLKKRGLWDQAIFIMMADHGTGLMEHGVYGGFHPWFEQIHVPLVIKLPGVKGRQIDTMVGLMDLGPTLSAIFSDAPADRYEGRSLWPVILQNQTWPDRILFGLNAFADCYYLLTADGLHYIKHRGNQYEQLFHWRDDPGEKRNFMGADAPGSQRAQKLMNWFLKDYGRGRNYNDPDHYEPPAEE